MAYKVLLYTTHKDIINQLEDPLFDDCEVLYLSDHLELFNEIYLDSDVIIFHLDSFNDDFEALLNYLLIEFPHTPIILLHNVPAVNVGIDYLKKGARGYGSSMMLSVHLHQAIDMVVQGNIWVYPELAMFMIQQTSINSDTMDKKIAHMEAREKEIIKYLCSGMRNKEIAALLSLSEISIKKALTAIYSKLNIKDRVELIAYMKKS